MELTWFVVYLWVLAIALVSSVLHLVLSITSKQLSQCKAWLVNNRLLLHVGKTKCILFGSSRRLKGANFLVKCGDVAVKRVLSVKYLGVIIDQSLNFREHALSIIKKATGKLYFLYRCKASLDGASRRLLCTDKFGFRVLL